MKERTRKTEEVRGRARRREAMFEPERKHFNQTLTVKKIMF